MEDIDILNFKYFSILQITFSYINDNQFVIPHYYIFIAWWWERYVYKDLLSQKNIIFRRLCHREIRFTLEKSFYLPHHYVISFWYWTTLDYTAYVEFKYIFNFEEKTLWMYGFLLPFTELKSLIFELLFLIKEKDIKV